MVDPINLEALRDEYGQEMTRDQRHHIEEIIRRTAEKLYRKYAAGQKEKKDNIWERDVYQDLEDEIIDLVVYNDLIQHQGRGT